MSKKLEAFKKANKPNSRSVLSAYASELVELKNEGYTQQQMLVFLRENGVKTTKQNLSAFLGRVNKNKNVQTKQGVKNEEKKVEKPPFASPKDDSFKTDQNDTKKQAVQSSEPKTKIIPPKKFEWNPNKEIEL